VSNLFLTLVIAFVIIVIAIACLAIGWLITGKTKLEAACGKDPSKTREEKEGCGTTGTCELCSAPLEKEKKNHRNLEKDE
jgi:hypothetical protein